MDIEALAVSAVDQVIGRTGKLESFIEKKDRKPFWDGEVFVYTKPGTTHKVEDYLEKVPVQVKGTTDAFSGEMYHYPVKIAHLWAYLTDWPTVFFVVCLGPDSAGEKIYYRTFRQADIRIVLDTIKAGQEEKSFTFIPFPTNTSEVEQLFLDLAHGRRERHAALASNAGAVPASYFPPLASNDIFLYNFGGVGFFGREKEIELLDGFLNAPGTFRWWGVIGPGGAGKSRLGYEWGKQVSEKGWTVRFLKAGDYKKLDTLTEQNPGPLLLIADYARQHAAELGKWMETLCDTERDDPLRLLLLERDEGVDAAGETPWEKELYLAGNEVHLRRARHEHLLQLPTLEDTPLRELIAAFAAELRKRDASLPGLTEAKAGRRSY